MNYFDEKPKKFLHLHTHEHGSGKFYRIRKYLKYFIAFTNEIDEVCKLLFLYCDGKVIEPWIGYNTIV